MGNEPRLGPIWPFFTQITRATGLRSQLKIAVTYANVPRIFSIRRSKIASVVDVLITCNGVQWGLSQGHLWSVWVSVHLACISRLHSKKHNSKYEGVSHNEFMTLTEMLNALCNMHAHYDSIIQDKRPFHSVSHCPSIKMCWLKSLHFDLNRAAFYLNITAMLHQFFSSWE